MKTSLLFMIYFFISLDLHAQMGRYYDEDSDGFEWDFKAFLILGALIIIGRYLIRRLYAPKEKQSEYQKSEDIKPFYKFIVLVDGTPVMIDSRGSSVQDAMNKKHIQELYFLEETDFLFYKKINSKKAQYSEDLTEWISKKMTKVEIEYFRNNDWQELDASQFLASYDFNEEYN